MKLKLCRNVHNINHYKSDVADVVDVALVLLLLRQLKIIIGKVKIRLYCYLIADILTRVLQNCSLTSPLLNLLFLLNPLNLIGCHGNTKAKFPRIKIKNHLLKRHNENEAETLQICLLD